MEMQCWPQRPFRANRSAMFANRCFPKIDEARALAGAIVESVRAPRLVLDADLRVVTANRAFYHMFKVVRRKVQGRPFQALDGGRWDIPEPRVLLANAQAVEVCEVDADVPGIGRRTLLLNARELYHASNDRALVLLSIGDISKRQTAELLQQKETLLQETEQRIANNLQIIAGILLLKAHAVQSEAARLYLKDTHQRLGIMEQGERIEIAPYFSRFCGTRAIAPVGDSHPITIEGQADSSKISPGKSVSIRRIAAELVVDTLKRAFVSDRAATRTVVAQKMEEPRWGSSSPTLGLECQKAFPARQVRDWALAPAGPILPTGMASHCCFPSSGAATTGFSPSTGLSRVTAAGALANPFQFGRWSSRWSAITASTGSASSSRACQPAAP